MFNIYWRYEHFILIDNQLLVLMPYQEPQTGYASVLTAHGESGDYLLDTKCTSIGLLCAHLLFICGHNPHPMDMPVQVLPEIPRLHLIREYLTGDKELALDAITYTISNFQERIIVKEKLEEIIENCVILFN